MEGPTEKKEAIEELLSALRDINVTIGKSFRVFGGEFIPKKEFDEANWLAKVQRFKDLCDQTFKSFCEEDEDFLDFCYAEVDKDLDLQCVKLIDEYVYGGCAEENGVVPPFPGYEEVSDEIGRYYRKLEWLSKKYGPGDPKELDNLRDSCRYGDFVFKMATNHKPIKLSYKGKLVNLSPSELEYCYIVMDRCFFSKSDVSMKVLENILGKDVCTLNKCQSEVNRKLSRFIGTKHFIKAVKIKPGHRTIERLDP